MLEAVPHVPRARPGVPGPATGPRGRGGSEGVGVALLLPRPEEGDACRDRATLQACLV